MNPKKNIHKAIPPNPENPFRVPEGYFDDVQKRVMERIRSEEQKQIRTETQELELSEEQKQISPEAKERNSSLRQSGMEHNAESRKRAGQPVLERTEEEAATGKRKIYLQPYITLAAAITGVALMVYIVLQSVMGNRAGETNPYDIATLDRAGIIHDEAILADAYAEEEEATTYSEWDEEAIVYLASNEVDLLELIDTN